jgi:ABC-type dipeptide transport system, periplasmic component
LSRHTVTIATAVVLSVGLILGTAACSSDSSKNDNQAGDRPSAAPKATLNQINPVDPTLLKQGGTLNFPVDQYSSQWNVLNAASNNEVSTVDTVQGMLPYIFRSSADNKLTVNTDYVTSAETVLKDGKQVSTYKINPKAKWSDGTPITWKDFQANWKVQNGKDSKYNATTTTGYSQIASVEKGASDTEAVVTYDTPFADWQSLFAPLYPASQIDTPAKFNNAYKGKIPVTAGPFKVGEMNSTTKVVSIVRDPAWWGTKAVLDKINFRTVDIASAPGAFASGEIDLTDIGPDVSAYKQAKTVPNASIRVAGGPNLRHIVANGQSPVLKDQRVRQALFMALNRDAIGKADLNGLPWPIKPLNNHFLVNNADGYKDNAGALGTYDPAKANELLDAAGWKKSGEFRTKNGKTLQVTFVIPASVPISANEAQLTTAMLKAVGVKVKTSTSASDVFFDDLNAGKFDLTAFSGIGAVPFFPLSNSQAEFQAPKDGNIGQNFSRLGSAELDAAMLKAGQQVDHQEYLNEVNEADALLWKLAIDLPLYQRPQIWATKPGLANFGAFGFQNTDFAKIGFTK